MSTRITRGAWHTLAPEIVDNILSLLPARSLVNALQVCHAWRKIVERVLKRRQGFVGRLFDSFVFESGCKTVISDFLDNIAIVPAAVIICHSFTFHTNSVFRSLTEEIKSRLPKNCLIFGCSAPNVIGTTIDGNLAQYDKSQGGISVLVIPKVQGVSVSLFKFSHRKLTENRSNHQKWLESFGDLATKNVKFVFLLGKTRYMSKVVHGTKKVFGSHVVITGGIVSKPFVILANGSYSSLSNVMGLAIEGPNVIANSVVDPKQKSALPTTIQRLYQNQPTKQSVCFLVKCVERKCQLDELVEFRKVFPASFQLLGFTSFGEIGSDMPLTTAEPQAGQSSSNNQQEEIDNNSEVIHSFAAVFSVLTFLDEKQ